MFLLLPILDPPHSSHQLESYAQRSRADFFPRVLNRFLSASHKELVHRSTVGSRELCGWGRLQNHPMHQEDAPRGLKEASYLWVNCGHIKIGEHRKYPDGIIFK